jgi:transcriptional regulator with XRE-family HTH domain
MGRPARKPADKAMMAHIGERLRWVREALDKSQGEMADAVGVHQTAWSLYERGQRWPDQFEIPRLLAKLKISREYLLEDTLEGVEAALAIRLAAKHPQLVPPISKVRRKGTARS